jgi:2,5-dichloro-2,5-cyclohexadiene-1,4-diol dehydrogenase 1
VFSDKTIVITGAGSGIGRATAKILAELDANLVVTDFDSDSAAETADLVSGFGGSIEWMRVDVSNESQVEAMVKLAVDKFGQLDGAFNNAGLPMQNKLVEELEVADWNRVMDVNLKGVFLCMKYEIAAMRKTGGGAVVNTSSGNGVVANPYASEYCASKHGVMGLTRGAACEAAITGVRVNAVMPGMIVTPMTQDLVNDPNFKEHHDIALARHTIGRFGQPEEIGYAVKWLLSDEASFVNGAGIAVDGGYTAR